MSDFLIIGGGINGLLLARELASADAEVVLLDRNNTGRESSWAGGGIVSPLYPWRYPPPITALASWAQQFYPGLVEMLLEETGVDAEYRPCGLLMLAAEDAAEALAWARSHGRPMEQMPAELIYRREPLLAAGFESGLWMPNVASVRNPRLCQALHASLKRHANVEIMERCQVVDFKVTEDRVASVSYRNPDSGEECALEADTVIVCAGAWSGALLAFLGLHIEVQPVKGQMLLFKFQRPPIHSILLTAGRYLIPRADGHVLAGSTLEHVGFDKTATAEARQELLESALCLLPSLREREPVAQWAGLRPGAPQGLPFIGMLEPYENLYVNAGQFRNGLVLAPASARLLADSLLGREPILDPSPYLPSRGRGSERQGTV